MQKTMLVFLLSVFLLSIFQTETTAMSAESYCVIENENGQILYEKNANKRLGMASTTKIMTALLSLESGKLNEIATVSATAAGTEGSSLYLKAGEKIRVLDLVYGLMLNSGNDAAVVLAEHIAGSVDKFVSLMNSKASAIGAKNTHFTNPNGLSDEAHYTTAYDLACIAAYALKNEKFQEIVSTKSMEIETINPARKIYLANHNKLLTSYDGCNGVKTGYTKATGRCLVSSVTKNGFQVVCVTLNAPDDWNDHKALYHRAFSEYEKRSVLEEGTVAGKVKVFNGCSEAVNGVVGKTVEVVESKDGQLSETEILLYDSINAPVQRGDVIGKAFVKQGGHLLGTADVIAQVDVPCLKRITYFQRFFELFQRVFYTEL